MTSLPEQLSAARKSQLDAQLRLFHNVASQALDHAGRLLALNLSASRDSVERSSRTLHQLIGAADARGLDVLRSHAEEQVRSLFAYGRALFDIAGGRAGVGSHGVRPLAQPAAPALAAPAAAPAAAQEAARAIDAGGAPARGAPDTATDVAWTAVQAAADAMDTAATGSDGAGDAAGAAEPVVVRHEDAAPPQALAEAPDAAAPAAKPRPIAKAAGKGSPKAAVAPHPMAAPVEGRDAASVTRIDTPPPRRRK